MDCIIMEPLQSNVLSIHVFRHNLTEASSLNCDCILHVMQYLYFTQHVCLGSACGAGSRVVSTTCCDFLLMEHGPELAHKVTPVINCWLHVFELFWLLC